MQDGLLFPSNVKQFSIRHLFFGIVLVGAGMGMVTSGSGAVFTFGIGLLVGAGGWLSATGMMFVSDLIDDRRIDDRRWWSRCFNFIGLMIVVGTVLTVAVIGLIASAQFLIWLVNAVVPSDRY